MVGRTPWSARDAPVPLPEQRYQHLAGREQAGGGVGRGPGVRPTRRFGPALAYVLRLGSGWLLDVRRKRKERKKERKNMPLINIVIALIVVGVGLWLINTYIPMASSIKTILNVVVVVAVVVWVLQAVGMWGRVTSYKFVN